VEAWGALPDRIELRGLRLLGTHGALPEESDRPQPFEVDIDLFMDLGPAGRSDDLAATADYGLVCEAARRVLEGPHVDLMEALAERVAAEVLESAGPGGLAVTVWVRKLRPPVGYQLGWAGVQVHRRRS
jgi:dihydroneopterin aldolase/2-amino-4-hydroxy-6-hydroxymethyldihydropteridine diphosphokinase